MQPKAHRYLTLGQALRLLFCAEPTSCAVQRLRRAILRKEAMLGSEIAIRLGSPPSPLYVTEPLLRDRMPELFSRRDQVVELLREQLDEMRDDIEECKKRDTMLARRVRQLRLTCTSPGQAQDRAW